MKKSSTIKKAQMGSAVPAKKSGPSENMKKFKFKSPIKRSKGPVYEGSTLPEYTVTAPKAKAGKSLGMKSVKAGYDNNPGVTRADIISAAKMKGKKAMYGTKVAGKKPIKKAQVGDNIKNYDQEGSMLPEATVTASRIVDKPSKPAKTKDWTRKVARVNRGALKRSGAAAGKMTNILGMKKRFKEGGEVEMAKKGASVKKAMGKCKYGC